MDEWFSGKAPKVDWSKVEQKAGSATRAASAACLGVLAEQVPNMICASADLSNSDKTDGFLKKTKSIVRGDFSGAFFQAGVAELTMADMCIGMMLHGVLCLNTVPWRGKVNRIGILSELLAGQHLFHDRR
jgi:transketolase